ncbi:MAG: hypothetical protein WBP40_01925 [Candidatus Moraniibacteriota bacterium]
MEKNIFGLNNKEAAFFRQLSTPAKIQDYLDTLPFNFEKAGPTFYSPRVILREDKAHCIEAACLAALALWYHGAEPLILDLRSLRYDFDHVVTLFRRNGYWGALSKTNHGVLRYRDPIYRTVRELALSYFHEYYLTTTGRKTLREYSRPFNLKRFGTEWVTSEDSLIDIAEALDLSRHYRLVPSMNERSLRVASEIEKKIGSVPEWRKTDRET